MSNFVYEGAVFKCIHGGTIEVIPSKHDVRVKVIDGVTSLKIGKVSESDGDRLISVKDILGAPVVGCNAQPPEVPCTAVAICEDKIDNINEGRLLIGSDANPSNFYTLTNTLTNTGEIVTYSYKGANTKGANIKRVPSIYIGCFVNPNLAKEVSNLEERDCDLTKKGDAINIQKKLVSLGYPLEVDGDFGRGSIHALIAYKDSYVDKSKTLGGVETKLDSSTTKDTLEILNKGARTGRYIINVEDLQSVEGKKRTDFYLPKVKTCKDLYKDDKSKWCSYCSNTLKVEYLYCANAKLGDRSGVTVSTGYDIGHHLYSELEEQFDMFDEVISSGFKPADGEALKKKLTPFLATKDDKGIPKLTIKDEALKQLRLAHGLMLNKEKTEVIRTEVPKGYVAKITDKEAEYLEKSTIYKFKVDLWAKYGHLKYSDEVVDSDYCFMYNLHSNLTTALFIHHYQRGVYNNLAEFSKDGYNIFDGHSFEIFGLSYALTKSSKEVTLGDGSVVTIHSRATLDSKGDIDSRAKRIVKLVYNGIIEQNEKKDYKFKYKNSDDLYVPYIPTGLEPYYWRNFNEDGTPKK